MSYLPAFIAPMRFTDPAAALAQARLIYDNSIAHLRQAMQRYVAGDDLPGHVRGCYPFVRVQTDTVTRQASSESARLSYGFVAGPGRFETTLTRPDLYARYYLEQFSLLLDNHGVELEVGTSNQPIPVHFSFAEDGHVEGSLSPQRRQLMRDVFDLPDLAAMDDGIANGTHAPHPGEPQPLSLFTAPRVDYSLQRLRHYTGTGPEHFQNFVLFTNYQFYIDEFIALGHAAMADATSEYIAFVEPGNVITEKLGSDPNFAAAQGAAESPDKRRANLGPDPKFSARLPQMPAYHLVRADGSGISMVNIGVGPANAKTITDHIAVLRPHAWIMLGHCAGLRSSQQLGDYVLAHGYVREDHVLDEELPLWVPIPALAEVQVALATAVSQVTQLRGPELKRIMRTGTVASTDNRNWELLPDNGPQRRFSQSRAVALDMESATIAANGFRFRVPYGTLLCVSDKPLHGEIKLPGMANTFYRERVDQHLRIGIRALELLREQGIDQLHSRKLRSFAEVAFQ
ncbi:MAG: AMP nucleosidase [Rhodoferax sp.]|uniref:AMP nucleosidase n=1 Tax=Rhodoferax sp. TaxID=50421 RepID=UPI003C718FAE|nr:AMP nucleosidase [Rhodoferax sp.]